MSIEVAIEAIKDFQGRSLTENLSRIEDEVIGCSLENVSDFCNSIGINNEFMNSALTIKQLAGQINVIIHSAGILKSLNGILVDGEVVESVSLGAGNTGRKFDLETNFRVAEFKFIDWRGGAESIRQNGIFKDYYELAEHKSSKKKYLYVVDTKHPLKFLNGGRALTSVLSRNPQILANIEKNYGEKIKYVKDYYAIKKDDVSVVDISPYIGR